MYGAKYTDEDFEKIAELYEKREPVKAISADLGIPMSYVYSVIRLINGKTAHQASNDMREWAKKRFQQNLPEAEAVTRLPQTDLTTLEELTATLLREVKFLGAAVGKLRQELNDNNKKMVMVIGANTDELIAQLKG